MTRLWSFDLDGVLAEPPLGWNPAINRDVSLQPDATSELPPARSEGIIDRLLSASWYRVRYVMRPPRPGALAAVRLAASHGNVIVLTGRHERGRRQTEAWLARHGFSAHVARVVMNASPLASARYKEAYLRGRNVALHVDDDAATAALLARTGIATAVVSWPKNERLEYPAGVRRCDHMSDVCSLIERIALDG